MTTKIKKHKKQIAALNDKTRFQFWLAGRRGGKTFAIRESILEKISKTKPGGEIWYIAPNNMQAKELMWLPLKDRMHELSWTFKDMVSKARFELPDRRFIYVLGAEKISRIRGHALDHAFLDEVAFFTQDLNEVWRAIRATLSDRNGGSTWSTTPNGKGTQAYDAFMEAQSKFNWSTHSWKTIDNPFISKDEIEQAKRELDEKSFLQEYEAQWQSFVGLAYYNFDETLHLEKCSDILPNVPIHLCFDFNVNPTTLLISQYINGVIYYKREYSLQNSSTEQTVIEFVEDFKHLKDAELRIRGDASGKNRSSTTGKSDYYYIKDILDKNGFRYQYQVLPKNPPIVDRVKHVNSWLKPYQGTPKVKIDPSCKELIRDLSSQELNGRVPSDMNNLGHKADALGYDVYYQTIASNRKQQRTILL